MAQRGGRHPTNARESAPNDRRGPSDAVTREESRRAHAARTVDRAPRMIEGRSMPGRGRAEETWRRHGQCTGTGPKCGRNAPASQRRRFSAESRWPGMRERMKRGKGAGWYPGEEAGQPTRADHVRRVVRRQRPVAFVRPSRTARANPCGVTRHAVRAHTKDEQRRFTPRNDVQLPFNLKHGRVS